MKKIGFILSALALILVSCNKEQPITTPTDDVVSNGKVKLEIKVTIDPETKASITDKKLSFAANDEIAVIGTKDEVSSVIILKVSSVTSEAVTFSTEIDSDMTIGDYAYYPATIADKDNPTQINWPATFDGTAAQLPMMAKIDVESSPKKAEFKHLGAILKVDIASAPAGTNILEFTTSNDFVGSYIVDPSTWALTGTSLSGKAETVAVSGNGTYYIPVPAGSYADFVLAMKEDDYYHKQKTAYLTSDITPERGQLVNLGTFTYDVDEIEEWYLLSAIGGWDTTPNNLRLIKVGTDKYEISSYVYNGDPWYKFYSPNNSVTGVAGATNGTMANDATCKRENDEIFTATLEKSGSAWELSYSGFGNDWDRCYELSNTSVYLKGDCNSWGEDIKFTKENHNNNMLWYYRGLTITDNKSYAFKFYVKGSDWEWWIGGNSVSLSDKYPYSYAVDSDGDNMYYTLTAGTYDIYLDIRTLAFMFVKQ